MISDSVTAIEQLKEAVLKSIDDRADEAVSVFREFVRIPSVYKDLSALRRSSEFIADQLTSSGVQTSLIESGSAGKVSVLGRIPGRRPQAGRSLILNGHMDIYPPGKSWTMDPFAAEVRDGRVYGQGTDDMKAGIVAMTLATCFLARHGIKLCGDLYLHAIPNHYNGGDGTRTALNSGLRADFAIVGEPTDMEVAVAQCGILYVNVTVTGIATHVSSQHLGVHPVPHAAHLMNALREIRFPPPEADPHGGSCHLNISAVHAEGLHRSLVPDDCTFTTDIRFTPSLGREGAYRAVEQVVESYVREQNGVKVDVAVDPTCVRNPRHATVVSPDAPISQAVARSAERVLGRQGRAICHPAWPDTPVFNDMGIQAVTFGPGSTACYWPDEFVAIKDYVDAIKIYCLTAIDTCRCIVEP